MTILGKFNYDTETKDFDTKVVINHTLLDSPICPPLYVPPYEKIYGQPSPVNWS